MTELWLAFAAGLVAWGVVAFIRLRRLLHILQLEEYLTPQYLHWLHTHPRRYLHGRYVVPAAGSLAIAVYVTAASAEGLVLLLWATLAALIWMPASKPRKPLVMTARARRVLVVASVLSIALVALGAGVGLLAGEREGVAFGVVVTLAVCLFAGHVVLLANLALWPLEERSRRHFQRLATEKLRENRPRIIAITGSAGKTTTKDLVAHLLAARYRVLKTPSSFNTPLGIARTVNDAYNGQEFFVVEMGAYRRGEIARLCALVGGTDVSVITTVNAQHLERFGSLEATARAKFEIVEGLRDGGVAVLNFDVAAVRELASAAGKDIQVLSFGVESENVVLRGTNVRETPSGIELDVTYAGQTVHLRSQLLARHNAGNLLAAIGVGLTCGLDLGYMAAAIERFAAPDHRLRPIEMANGVTMLDDGYNANPDGIIGALEVLGAYQPRRRVLVTSGLIEMGSEKAAYHARIGKAAAAHADVAVLVGPRQTAEIREAMIESSFPAACLHVARNPEEAQTILARVGMPGDVILHSTDLPDQFDEYLVI